MSVLGPFLRLIVELGFEHELDWITVPGEGGTEVATWTDDYELRKLTVKWSRTPSIGVVQDADMCTFHFVNLTGGDPDPTWTGADFLVVENAFDTFWAAVNGSYYNSEIKLSEYSWRADGPAFKPFGASLSPTLRVVAKSLPGSGASAPCPPQCAISVTEVTEAHYTAYGVGVPGHAPGTGRTQVRNRWGRFYLPAPGVGALSDGRLNAGVCATFSTAVKAMYNTCVAGQIIPVMYSPTTGQAWSITEVHVDDIVDVVRSRRYVTPLTRAVNAINPP